MICIELSLSNHLICLGIVFNSICRQAFSPGAVVWSFRPFVIAIAGTLTIKEHWEKALSPCFEITT